MASINDIDFGIITSRMGMPAAKYSTAALSGSTASAGQLSGALVVVMNNSGANPGTYTTRTARQMITDSNLKAGQAYLLLLSNGQGTGILTLAGGTGVTITGTATVAVSVARVFVVTVDSDIAMTFTNCFITGAAP